MCGAEGLWGEGDTGSGIETEKGRDPALWSNAPGVNLRPLPLFWIPGAYSAGLVMTAQAMRGGAALLAWAATA